MTAIVAPRERQRIIDECIVPYLGDRRDAWVLNAQGDYERMDGPGPSAQAALMRLQASKPAA